MNWLRSRWLLGSAAVLFCASPASAYEGARREVVDGGVHQPVMTRAPELLVTVPADYPKEALAQGKTAAVRMRITVGVDGKVTQAEVVEQVGDGFDEAALLAVREFTFRPAEVDGVPAPVQIEYVQHFTISAPENPKEAPPPLATLTGRLAERGSRGSVEGATLRCGEEAASPEAVSDARGRFELRVPPGRCDLRAVANGYEPFRTAEELKPGETLEVTYFMAKQPGAFETVVRGARDKKEVVRRTLQRDELQKVPGTFGDPIRVIQNLPGLVRAPFISGQLIVRGSNPNQTLTVMDGVEIPLLFHLGGGPSVVNAEFLDKVDFYPGGFGARYGRAIGGVVDVSTRKGARDTLHGVVKVDLLDASVFVETPIVDGVSVAAAVRRSYIDALLPAILPLFAPQQEGGTLFVVPRYWDYQVRVDVGKTPQDPSRPSHTFYAMAFGSDDALSVVATGGGRNRDFSVDFRTLFHRLKADWTFRHGRFKSTFAPYVGFDLAQFSFGEIQLRGDVWSVGGREDLTFEFNKWFTLRAGADVLFEHTQGRGAFPALSGTQYVAFPGAEPDAALQEVKRNFNRLDAAVFVEADFSFGPLRMTPGVRATGVRAQGQGLGSFDPRLWIRYGIGEKTAVKGSVGLYSQAPDAIDLEQPPFGNPNLWSERGFQTSVGVERRLTDAINVDLTGYFNRRFDNIVSPGRTTVNADRSVTQEASANFGLGRAYGLEVLLRHDVTKNFFGWIAYTFNRSEARRTDRPEDPYRVTTFDQTHVLTLVASYRLPWGFELGGRYRYATGRPKTPLLGLYDVYGVDGNRYFSTPGEPLTTRFRAFNQLDLRLQKDFVFRTWTLAVYLDVQNVLNTQNVEATLFDYRFRQEISIPGIPILPVLGVRGSF
ncbi:MAG: TonB family protein [Myxococcaceae bacterium]